MSGPAVRPSIVRRHPTGWPGTDPAPPHSDAAPPHRDLASPRSDPALPGRTGSAARRLAVVALVFGLLGSAAACGGDDTSTESTSPTSTAPTSSTSTDRSDTTDAGADPTASTGPTTPEPTTEGIDPMDDAGTDPVSGTAQVEGTALISEVAVARHEGYDRVVFTFENGRPGYQVGYVDGPLTEDGSGEPVAVEGSAYLQVRMEPASIADLSGEEYRPTYTGPSRIDADTPEVTEVVRTGDFEAVAHWVIGVTDPGVAFRVLTLSDPPRLVVDVQNH